MARFPEDFKRQREVSATYAFTELASGLGFERFWILVTRDDSSTDYSLIDNNSTESNINNGSVNGTTTEYNIDTSAFNLTRTVSGTAYFNMGYDVDSGVSGTVTARLYKYDGATETAITAEHTETFAADETEIESFQMPCTDTLISEGDVIRLKLTITA